MIANCGVKSWKPQRSCRGTLHDDDDDPFTVNCVGLLIVAGWWMIDRWRTRGASTWRSWSVSSCVVKLCPMWSRTSATRDTTSLKTSVLVCRLQTVYYSSSHLLSESNTATRVQSRLIITRGARDYYVCKRKFCNPLTPTVAIWVQL